MLMVTSLLLLRPVVVFVSERTNKRYHHHHLLETCRVGLRRLGGRRDSGGGPRTRPAACRVALRCGPALALAPFPVPGRSSLWTVSCCWGGWLVLLLVGYTYIVVCGCLESEASLICVRLDVGPLPPRSSSQPVAGCWLGGFPVRRDLWGGDCVVVGVLPRISIGTDV